MVFRVLRLKQGIQFHYLASSTGCLSGPEALNLTCGYQQLPYLPAYRPHFFQGKKRSKFGVRLIRGYKSFELINMQNFPTHTESGAPNDNFRENICSEDDLSSRIFGTFVVKFLACLPLLGFSNI